LPRVSLGFSLLVFELLRLRAFFVVMVCFLGLVGFARAKSRCGDFWRGCDRS
jgi:hypothetical protein